MLYRCDGASRGQGRARAADGEAYFGAVGIVDGHVVGKRAGQLGQESNNIAEYAGALACLKDAFRRASPSVTLQMDSLLVIRQL